MNMGFPGGNTEYKNTYFFMILKILVLKLCTYVIQPANV